ncbi:MAG: glycine cleavage system aminomethyltransferase GcvT [Caldiserica bacterium]|jgi:aminomethyltransferase|nr:glycine cleavage system aminomethyltransferase GcvT [Caldisericota bacterium]MDH7562109.1 glycine cleavage system aminomethyltransferase GcvT [Caldisericota bacterium]
MLRRTPLFEIHLQLGARMVPFAGWEMPVQYRGIVEEHLAVRGKAGLFDVSHMGDIRVKGPKALEFLQFMTPNDVSRLKIGQSHYSMILNREGGIKDDLIIGRLGEEEYFLVVNASNAEKDFLWLKEHERDGVEVLDESSLWGEVALQGPLSQEILQRIVPMDLNYLFYFHLLEGKIDGIPVIISRTGYTGEDGFEILSPWDQTPQVWNLIMEKGKDLSLEPCGLGARNTLRLEMKMALHGNDIDETTNPYEAGLGWVVKLQKGDFIGRDALLKVKEEGPRRKLVGFELLEPGVPREHYKVFINGEERGMVTSGAFSPSLKKGIGLAYVPVGFEKPGTLLDIQIREKLVPAQVVETPFWKAGTAGKLRAKEV